MSNRSCPITPDDDSRRRAKLLLTAYTVSTELRPVGWMVICRKMNVTINGEDRSFPELGSDAKLADLIAILGLKSDRIAVEHNGEIAARSGWEVAAISPGDKLEIVHFVGGGLA